MTKRLLAIALVVLVAVSAMYLPSVLNVAAADTTVTVDKPTYDGTIKAYTVTVNGNTTQIANLSASDIADEASLKKAIEREMPAYKDQVGTAVISGTTVTVTLAKTLSISVKSNTAKKPSENSEIAKVDALVGSSVTDLIAKLPTPPVVMNKVFTNWNIGDVDAYYDNKIDDGATQITANYVDMTNNSATKGPYTINVYVAAGSKNTISQLTSGAYASSKEATDYSATTKNSFTASPELVILDGTNTDGVKETNAIADVQLVTPSDKDAGKYEFAYWLVRTTASTQEKPVYNTKDYVAIYKPVAAPKTYKYTFKNEDGSDFGAGKDVKVSVDNNTLTNNPYELLNADQKKAIADYLGDTKTIKSWTITTETVDPDTKASKLTVTLVPTTLYDYTYYYVDANGNYAKTVKKYDNDAAALGFDAGAAKGHTFVKWNKVAGENTFNGFYNVGEPEKPVIYPVAKKGNDSFAFASTATPKTAKYKKTMTARVTAGKGTFNKAEVKLVNKSVKLSANAINCTVKKGTMKETSGTPYTITFNKKGTAYVVVSISYNGNVYTKTLTKTVK